MVVGDRSHEVVMVGVRAWSRGEEIRRINVASMSIWGKGGRFWGHRRQSWLSHARLRVKSDSERLVERTGWIYGTTRDEQGMVDTYSDGKTRIAMQTIFAHQNVATDVPELWHRDSSSLPRPGQALCGEEQSGLKFEMPMDSANAAAIGACPWAKRTDVAPP